VIPPRRAGLAAILVKLSWPCATAVASAGAIGVTVTGGGVQTPLWARLRGTVEAAESLRTAAVPDISLARRRASQSSA
jgi:hypothetical protein